MERRLILGAFASTVLLATSAFAATTSTTDTQTEASQVGVGSNLGTSDTYKDSTSTSKTKTMSRTDSGPFNDTNSVSRERVSHNTYNTTETSPDEDSARTATVTHDEVSKSTTVNE